ncbi:MAG: hypothetical protein M0Z94_19505 [Dehalococcoidales bacterium]|nr:hypothetical protein [Dehalococcoidales bacterium]
MSEAEGRFPGSRTVASAGCAAGAVVGMGFAVFHDGQARRQAAEGAIGVSTSPIILVSAIAFAGAFI